MSATKEMSENKEIVCKASNWIKIRGVLILLMFGVFGVLFYKDGSYGYKEKNLHFFMHELFTQEAPKAASGGEFTAESWTAFAGQQEVNFSWSKKPDEIFPVPEGSKGMKWPAELVNGYEQLKGGNSSSEARSLWTEYTGKMRWNAKPVEEPYTQAKVNEQFYFAYGCAGLFVVVLFFFLRTLSRNMRVTDEAYFAPGGTEVPFSAMRRLDKRKWDNKGVAVIEYDKGAGLKKVKIDGMIYGHFKKEDGEPAEKLFQKVLSHFKGEVIEYETEESADEDKAEVST